ncbi:HAD family hydrolase [Kitasatospora sp. NPDC048365]|uniref:HAD family hydrolase n=1 Tax=Kitasatospora sp. NPDC048365 TaxID=3364050 RepID=UPI0037197B64
MTIKAVVFDVGECLVDESREYGTWADWLGVPRHTFVAQFGATIARGLDYRETFQVFRPGFDLHEERERRAAAGKAEWFGEDDLYPDVRRSLTRLRAEGLWLAIAGNQTVRAGGILRGLFTGDVDLIGTSDDWGASKPDPEFFRRVSAVTPTLAEEILYVGDRLDNDILPAAAAGMRTALIRRGPWGWIQQHDPAAAEATFRIDSLAELPDLIAKFNAEVS